MLDFVITWVNGNDAHYQERMRPYLTAQQTDRQDIAGANRYEQIGEIYYCVASILRFAGSFTRKIFIVTDQQDPHIEEHFPQSPIPIEIIDHSVIFKGYEQYLPVFNSRAIEIMLYRIPDLSEHYVYMNDDCMLVRPVQESDFVQNGKCVAYTKRFPVWLERCIETLSYYKKGYKQLTFKSAMLQAAQVLHKPYFEHLLHTPQALSKTWAEQFYAQHPEVIIRNISHRFRDAEQVNPQSLFFTDALTKGLAIRAKRRNRLCFLRCGSKKKNYLQKHLQVIETHPSIYFACFNDLPLLSSADLTHYQSWAKDWLRLS